MRTARSPRADPWNKAFHARHHQARQGQCGLDRQEPRGRNRGASAGNARDARDVGDSRDFRDSRDFGDFRDFRDFRDSEIRTSREGGEACSRETGWLEARDGARYAEVH